MYEEFADTHAEPEGRQGIGSSRSFAIGLLAILPVLSAIVYLLNHTFTTAVIGLGVPIFCLLVGLRIIRGSLWQAEEQAALELKPPVQPNRRIARQLSSKETVLVEMRLHPLSELKIWVALAVLQPIAIYALLATDVQARNVVLAVWFTCTAILVGYIYEWGHSRFCVTNRRLLMAKGLLDTTYPAMPLSKLTDETFIIPFASKVLARLRIIRTQYGTIVVESAGQKQALSRIKYVRNANAVNRLIMGHTMGGGDGE